VHTHFNMRVSGKSYIDIKRGVKIIGGIISGKVHRRIRFTIDTKSQTMCVCNAYRTCKVSAIFLAIFWLGDLPPLLLQHRPTDIDRARVYNYCEITNSKHGDGFFYRAPSRYLNRASTRRFSRRVYGVRTCISIERPICVVSKRFGERSRVRGPNWDFFNFYATSSWHYCSFWFLFLFW